ncbi:MAG: class I SAM-dependent methyltransferase [Planctomycetota bacterium]
MTTVTEIDAGHEGAVALLDRTQRDLEGGASHRAMRRLFAGLQDVRRQLSPVEWRRFATETAIHHPVRALLHRDPMTRRSFDKPRGYSGDAVLLDYIYRVLGAEPTCSIGRSVYDYAVARTAACGVRHRRDLLARALDDAADEKDGGAHVLSVACGHLREAELSAAARRGGLDRLLALDADGESLAAVAAAHGPRTECLRLSVRRLLTGRHDLGRFDLVYSAGLFDYLALAVARRLTRRMFDLLRPGGRLLLSNFVPGVSDAGYMESFMGWDLILRTPPQLAEVAAELPRDAIHDLRLSTDPFGAIAYLDVRRAGPAQQRSPGDAGVAPSS